MSSAGLDWRNNPIPLLHGSDGPNSPPGAESWHDFIDSAQRVTDSVGFGAAFKMIEAMALRPDFIPLFIDLGAIPGPDGTSMDYNQTEFKVAVVQFAHNCGYVFRTGMPAPGDVARLDECLNELKVKLASFGAQIKKAAVRHRPAVFIGNDRKIAAHPLRSLIEFRKLEATFYPFINAAPTVAWEDLNRAALKDLRLDPAEIEAQMTEITLIRNQLMNRRTAADIDETFIGTFIRRLQAAEGDGESSEVRLWRSDAAGWHKQFENDPASLPWDVLHEQVSRSLTRFAASAGTETGDFGNKRPRISASAPPGIAMFSEQEAYGMAMQAAQGAYMAASSSGICYNCGKPGHIQRFCPNITGVPPPTRTSMRYAARGRGFGGVMGRGIGGAGGTYPARGGRGAGGAFPARGGRGGTPGGTMPGRGMRPGGIIPGRPGGRGGAVAYAASVAQGNAHAAGMHAAGQVPPMTKAAQRVYNKPFAQTVGAAMYAGQYEDAGSEQQGFEQATFADEEAAGFEYAGGADYVHDAEETPYDDYYEEASEDASSFGFAAIPGHSQRSAELGEMVKAHAYFAFGGNFGLGEGLDGADGSISRSGVGGQVGDSGDAESGPGAEGGEVQGTEDAADGAAVEAQSTSEPVRAGSSVEGQQQTWSYSKRVGKLTVRSPAVLHAEREKASRAYRTNIYKKWAREGPDYEGADGPAPRREWQDGLTEEQDEDDEGAPEIGEIDVEAGGPNPLQEPRTPKRRKTSRGVVKFVINMITCIALGICTAPPQTEHVDIQSTAQSSVTMQSRGRAAIRAPRMLTGIVMAMVLVMLFLTQSTMAAHTAPARPRQYMGRPAQDLHVHGAAAYLAGGSNSHIHTYFLDTGCSTTIISNPEYIRDVRHMKPHKVQGLAGSTTYELCGDLHMPITDDNGLEHTLVLRDVLFDPSGDVNLISAHDVNQTGWDTITSKEQKRRGMYLYPPGAYIPVARVSFGSWGKLSTIKAGGSEDRHQAGRRDMAHFAPACGNMSVEELLHLRMLHMDMRKLAQMSGQVDGVPRPLHYPRMLRHPCSTCREAKATRNPYPPASDRVSATEDDMITWDLVDMGQGMKTIGGNRYMSIFVVRRSRYAIIALHDERANFVNLVRKVVAKAGFIPKKFRFDGAAECISEEMQKYCDDNMIQIQYSNPREQFGNGISEKMVDTLGRGIRTALLQSHLPPEFWGLAAHFAVDVYNHTPHASLQGRIPYAEHHGTRPDVSWFRPFGCEATLFRGRDVVEHHKLSARGERGCFVGLGMSHGRRAWLIWVPRLQRVFASRNVQFDDTLFPMKVHDQRVYGIYDNKAITQMRAEAYKGELTNKPFEEVMQMPMPPEPVSNNIDFEFDPFTDDEMEMRATDCDEEYGVHPAVEQRMQVRGGGDGIQDGGGTADGGGSEVASRRARDEVVGGDADGATACTGALQSLPNAEGSRFPGAPGQYGQRQKQWWHCETQDIAKTSDEDLANYFIGHSIPIPFPQSFWPEDKGVLYMGEALREVHKSRAFPQQVCVEVLLTVRKGRRKKGAAEFQKAIVPVSKPTTGPDVSLRHVIASVKPKAVKCVDLTENAQGKKYVEPQAREGQPQPMRATGRCKIMTRPVKSGMALLSMATMAMLAEGQEKHNFTSVFHERDPANQRAARACSRAKDWMTAEEIELKKLYDMGTWKIVDTPPGADLLPMTWSYKVKRDDTYEVCQRKARINVRGDLQYPWEYNNTHSPTARFAAVRTIVALAAQDGLDLYAWDIAGAFCTSMCDKELYLQAPPGYPLPEGKCLKLIRSQYGLKQASSLFHDDLERWMLEYGFEAVGPDGVMFVLNRDGGKIIVSLHVDDGLCATNSSDLYQKFLADLSKRYKLSDQGKMKNYVGVRVQQNRTEGNITLDQEKYIDMMLERFSMDEANDAPTPYEAGTKLSKSQSPATPDKETVKAYQQLVGALMWAATITRPDIAFGVNMCARFMANPGPAHVAAAKRILKYLKGTKELKLKYSKSATGGNILHAYADADHAGDPDTRRSVSGTILMLNGSAVAWQSVRQHVTALSTAEAEYYAASNAGIDILYTRRIMEEMGYPQSAPTKTYEDNMACIYMSRTSVMYHKARHIDTRVYRLREMCQEKAMVLEKVKSAEQTADTLTKALARPAFERHRDVMMGVHGIVYPDTQTAELITEDGQLHESIKKDVMKEVGPLTPAVGSKRAGEHNDAAGKRATDAAWSVQPVAKQEQQRMYSEQEMQEVIRKTVQQCWDTWRM